MSDVDIAYRPDIDGLRALAVAAVILYHGYPGAVRGGFVGVDVFFVISGFLISANIFRRLDSGRFSFADFYRRRVRRIFPALLVVLATCVAYGFVILLPNELALLGRDALAGAAFVSNLLLWHEAGYFDRAAIYKPLLHLWSLGVEEQFYIVWPLALWLLYRRRRRSPVALVLMGVLSLGFSVAMVRTAPTEDFYNPLTRLWELDTGAVLAFVSFGPGGGAAWRQRRLGRYPAADLASAAGFALILLSALLIDRRMAFPGWLATLPVAGALALIAAGPEALVNRRVLARPSAVFVGLISYPLYLWHWPLISCAYILSHGRPLKPLPVLGLILLAGLLAWLTYRFVERPLRFGPRPAWNARMLAGLMGAVAACGLTIWLAGGFPSRYPTLPVLSVAKINAAMGAGVFDSTRSMQVRKDLGITVSRIGSGRQAVLFVGDSVIYQYGARVQTLLDEGLLDRRVYFAAGASCAPVQGMVRVGGFAFCNHLMQVASRLIDRRHIGTIVIGAFWAGYTGGNMWVVRHGAQWRLNTAQGVDGFYANLEQEIRGLVASGHRVYLVLLPVSDSLFNPQDMITRSLIGFHVDRRVMDGVTLAALHAARAAIDRKLMAIAVATGAQTLDPLRDVCGRGPICSAFFDHGRPKFVDGLHLQPSFVAARITVFDPILTRPSCSCTGLSSTQTSIRAGSGSSQ